MHLTCEKCAAPMHPMREIRLPFKYICHSCGHETFVHINFVPPPPENIFGIYVRFTQPATKEEVFAARKLFPQLRELPAVELYGIANEVGRVFAGRFTESMSRVYQTNASSLGLAVELTPE